MKATKKAAPTKSGSRAAKVKAAPTRSTPRPAGKKAPARPQAAGVRAKAGAPVATKAAAGKAGATKAGATKAGATKSQAVKTDAVKARATKAQPAPPRVAEATRRRDAAGARTAAPAASSAPPPPPPPARVSELDKKFLAEQRGLLLEERSTYVEQAEALKAEADSLAQDMEPGDIQFDDESGEGGTMTVERERDLALSAQARAAVEEIDHALAKIAARTYGLCERCGQEIPRPRLKALPYARLCVACKSGGLSRR
ncbi:MAG TPA: TraR/DksA C4-type zinc finger protein [Acidimicrobiales bacterium]|nr:TraR/DksA C4-type zinc finger protein [Acidimicrobiales bacterium]